jgi:hypothetical protein
VYNLQENKKRGLWEIGYEMQWGNPGEPSGYYVYHQVQRSQILRSAHTVYLCVLCGSQNKQRLFRYTALTDWFV